MPPTRTAIEAFLRGRFGSRINNMLGTNVDGVLFKDITLGPDRIFISQKMMRGATGREIRSITVSRAVDIIEAAGCDLTDIPCAKAALVAKWPELRSVIPELDT